MSSDKKQPIHSLIIETVAGAGYGSLDAALSRSEFRYPFGLCRFGDSLIVADFLNETIRQVTGVLGVVEPLAMEDNDIGVGPSEFESHAVPLVMKAILVLPKELVRLIALYAVPNGRVITIAGVSSNSGHVDGHALGEALFHSPSSVAVDESDSVAGPRLIICESRIGGACVRCLTFRTGLVTTIAGSGVVGYVDGPGCEARFSYIYGVAVAPNGTIYVSNANPNVVRRISSSVERTVTTLIGLPECAGAKNARYARSSTKLFQQPLRSPICVALHVGDAERDQSGDADYDIGVLYVPGGDEVYAFDLTRREQNRFELPHISGRVRALAVTEDGTRLFAVTLFTVEVIDTRTRACTTLLRGDGVFTRGCVIDKETRSLVMIDSAANRLIRLRGIDV